MPIDVLAGPGCLGVKQVDADRLLEELGPDSVLIDSTRIYESLGGTAASPQSDPKRFAIARYLQGVAIRQANERGINGIVTTSSGSRERLTALAEAGGGRILVADPGRAAVCRRLEKLLPDNDERRTACAAGLDRWYQDYVPAPEDIEMRARETEAMSEFRCAIEYRVDDTRESPGRIVGTLLTFGERAADRPEVFAPNSLTFADGLILNRQHQRGAPIMRFTPELRGRELVIDAKLPNTAAGRDAAIEIKSGLMRGLSVEFIAKREENRGGLRTILSGELRGAGLVDSPELFGFVGCGSSARRAGGSMAVTIDAATLKASVNGLNNATDEAVDRLLAVGIAIVEIEAPDAPAVAQNEAVIRAVAWLFQTGISVGELSVDNRSHAASAVRASGARALLAPWIERTL